MAHLNWQELRRVLMRPGWTPTDCPNFLVYEDPAEYRKYALGILPLLVLGGARVRWYGDRIEALRGDSPCETLMIVRYKSHRAMIAMILLPYYQVINRYRMRGTRALQLSFTEPVWEPETLGGERYALGVHFNSAQPSLVLRRLDEAAARHHLRISYASADRQGFSFLERPRRNDPNPLQYPNTALIAGQSEALLRTLAEDAPFLAAVAAAQASCVQLYERKASRDILRKG